MRRASKGDVDSLAPRSQRVQLSDELQKLRDGCVEVIEQLAEQNPAARPRIMITSVGSSMIIHVWAGWR